MAHRRLRASLPPLHDQPLNAPPELMRAAAEKNVPGGLMRDIRAISHPVGIAASRRSSQQQTGPPSPVRTTWSTLDGGNDNGRPTKASRADREIRDAAGHA